MWPPGVAVYRFRCLQLNTAVSRVCSNRVVAYEILPKNVVVAQVSSFKVIHTTDEGSCVDPERTGLNLYTTAPRECRDAMVMGTAKVAPDMRRRFIIDR